MTAESSVETIVEEGWAVPTGRRLETNSRVIVEMQESDQGVLLQGWVLVCDHGDEYGFISWADRESVWKQRNFADEWCEICGLDSGKDLDEDDC